MEGNMTIVGFNFTRIEAEKKEIMKGKININNNVSIKNVEEKKFSLSSDKQKVMGFGFEFSAKYDPDVGSIRINGDVLYMDNAGKAKEILDGWKKDKKLPKDIMPVILNTVLNKCNIQALILSEQINLPPPIPMPKLQTEQQK